MRHRMMLTLAFAALVPGTALALLPQPQQFQGTRFLSGGVGAAEVEAMRAARADYTLGMTFAAQTGQYLSGVKVEVKDQAGDVVLAAVSDGPMVLADLPKGRYAVEATFDGRTQRREVTLAERAHRHLVIHWPVPGLSAPPAEAAASEPRPAR